MEQSETQSPGSLQRMVRPRSLTPNQARDGLLESLGPLTTEVVREVIKMGRECTEARKADPETYLRCPRCYGYHSVHGNFDNLCDQCQQTIMQYFPDHESVPHIKAALAKWSNAALSQAAITKKDTNAK